MTDDVDELDAQDPTRAQSEQVELDEDRPRGETPSPELEKRALVVVAHPDDAEFGCAATTAKLTRAGWQVWTVVVTDASGGGDDHATDVGPAARAAISDTRKREQREAGEVLGLAGVEFLDYPDGRVEATLELRRDIVRLVRRLRPSVVFAQSPDRKWDPFYIGRHHPDHLAVGTATVAALYPAARNAWDFPELLDEGLLPHRVRELWVMGAPTTNHFVDVSETVDAKIEALRRHRSQLADHFDELEADMRKRHAELGAKHGVGAAEEFYRAEIG
jgi:LmbE family N-acetylglucosaminyl deacetylase